MNRISMITALIICHQISGMDYLRDMLVGLHLTENNNVVTTDIATLPSGGRIYTTTYPFSKKCGLIRIIDCLLLCKQYPDDCKKLKVILDRHKENTVSISAEFSQKIVNMVDESINDKTADLTGIVWVPWTDDTMSDEGLCMKRKKKAQVRGKNRLFLTLRQYGTYRIQIPEDADAEIGLSAGTIDYKSRCDTKLYIDASTVNRGGTSGGSGEREQWHYYWHTKETDPLTELITKTGHINVPNK